MGERIALLSFPTAVLALVVATQEAAWAIAVAVALIALAPAVWYRTWRSLDKRAQHLARLETQINTLVLGVAPQDAVGALLSWETQLCLRRARLSESSRPLTRAWGKVLFHKPTAGAEAHREADEAWLLPRTSIPHRET